jgi:hypothetical protein
MTDQLDGYRIRRRGIPCELAKYTSFGCYPLLYVDGRDQALCAECANEFDAADVEADSRPIAACVNWGDPNLFCDQCGERIESAYAEEEVTK